MIPDDPIESDPPLDDVIEPPQQQPKPPASMDEAVPSGNGQPQPDTIKERLRQTRELIPVGPHGVTPENYAQYVDVAQGMVKAYLMLPEHLHNNVPVMVAILDISARRGLSPYLVASKTYVQNNRLCFESQLFSAFLYASGLLYGRLRFEFEGEGGDLRCIVRGRFRDNPNEMIPLQSEPIKMLHPGYTLKQTSQSRQMGYAEGQKLKAEAAAEGRIVVGLFSRGSPLWDRKPRQQLLYDTQRDWIRAYAPDCVLGMYTPEEIAEAEEFRRSRNISEDAEPLTKRLGHLDTGEGWRDGEHVNAELARIAPDEGESARPEPSPKKPEKPAPAARRKAARERKPAARAKPSPARKTPPEPSRRPTRTGKLSRVGRQPSRAEVRAAVKRAEQPLPRRGAPPPAWLDYVQEAEKWIGDIETVAALDKGEKRWDDERDRRDKLVVPVGERGRLRSLLDRKVARLRPKSKEGEE